MPSRGLQPGGNGGGGGRQAARCIVQVRAGIIPGEPTISKSWTWTSGQQDDLESKDHARHSVAHQQWITMAGESRELAAWLENPGRFNWVERTWTWL